MEHTTHLHEESGQNKGKFLYCASANYSEHGKKSTKNYTHNIAVGLDLDEKILGSVRCPDYPVIHIMFNGCRDSLPDLDTESDTAMNLYLLVVVCLRNDSQFDRITHRIKPFNPINN